MKLREIKKKKRRVDSDIKSLNQTADELCLKAEAAGKLTFATQANSPWKTAKDKTQELADLDANLNSRVEQLKHFSEVCDLIHCTKIMPLLCLYCMFICRTSSTFKLRVNYVELSAKQVLEKMG